MRTSRPADGSRPPAERQRQPRRRRRAARAPIAAMAALVLLALAAGPAAATTAQEAATTAQEVAARLKQAPVYRHPQVTSVSAQGARELLARVNAADLPIFIAILPDAARAPYRGDPVALAVAIGREVGRRGTYMVTSGAKYGTGSIGGPVSSAQARSLARDAFNANGGDLEAGLLQWVDGVKAAAGRGEPVAQEGRGGGGGGVLAAVAMVALLVGGGALIFGGRRRRQR